MGTRYQWRDGLLVGLLVAIAASLATYLLMAGHDLRGSDCSPTPGAYHPGTIVRWQPRPAGAKLGGSADDTLFAVVGLDRGGEVVAFNPVAAGFEVESRVMVAEIACVSRTIYLLTAFPPPARRHATQN